MIQTGESTKEQEEMEIREQGIPLRALTATSNRVRPGPKATVEIISRTDYHWVTSDTILDILRQE